MDEVQYEVDGDGFGLPDVPHMEIMMDAMTDTVSQIDGAESFSLTQAQLYAQGVLMAAGVVSARQVTGNEGLFSAIGDGFAAAWKYIKETFTSIWNFFFSRDSEKEAEDAKDKIEENNEAAKKAADGTQSEAEVNKQIAAIAALPESPESASLREAAKAAQKADLKAKRAAIKAALKEMPKMNKKAVDKLAATVASAVKTKKAFLAVAAAGGSDKEKAAIGHLSGNPEIIDVVTDMAGEVTKFSTREASFVTQLENAHKISDVSGVIAFGKASQANIDQLKALSDTYKGKKSKIDSILKKTEANLSKAKEAKDKAELNKEIAALRVLVNLGVRVSKLIESNYTRVQTAHTDLCKVFCLDVSGSEAKAA